MNTSIEDRKKDLAFNAELSEKVKSRQIELEGEVIEDVLIREGRGGGDRVFVLNSIPKTFFYKSEREMIPTGKEQYPTPSGLVIDQLLPGIEYAKEDNSYIFLIRNRESKARLDAIDGYIRSLWPHNRPLPTREFYAMQPGITSSPAKPRSMILRVDIPASPPAGLVSAASGPPSLDQATLEAIKEQVKKELLAEQKTKQSANLAKARAAKAKKKGV